ncbi:MAG: hypothetical protein N2167_04660 [Flavobacteriales bacterium]|nr:hypothetical protein [Flavobacteriales bacterium]
MIRDVIRNAIALENILLILFSFNQIIYYAQPTCDIHPASSLTLKFFCDSLITRSSSQFTYQLKNEQGAIVYYISIQKPSGNPSSSDSVFSFLHQQYQKPWNNLVFSQKTTSCNFLPSNRIFKFQVKGIAEGNNASYVREMAYVKTLKYDLVFDIIYAAGTNYRTWNDAILQSIKDDQNLEYTHEETNFNIKTSIPYLKIQQDLLDNYLKRIIIFITLNGQPDIENYKNKPYLILQDITHKPHALIHIHDSLKKEVEINPNTLLIDSGIKKDLPMLFSSREAYFLRYKTKLIDRLRIVGDQQVEEWLIETDRGIKLHIGFYFPCEIGLSDCFQENPLYYKVFESLLKDISIK